MSLENKDEDLSSKLESKLKHPSKTPLKKSSTSSKNLKQVNFLSSSPKKQAKNPKMHRVRSRISNAVEKSFNQELFTAEEDKNTSISSGDDNFESFQKTMINISVVISEAEKIVKTISIIVNSKCKMPALVNRALNDLNKQFEKEQVAFRLNSDPDNYVIKPAKKKGYPKVDMPCFSNETTVEEADTKNFAICWKDDPDNFKIMFEIHKKAGCQNKCVIF